MAGMGGGRLSLPAVVVRLERLLPQPAVAVATALLAVVALAAAWRAGGASLPVEAWPTAVLALSLSGAVVAAYRYPIHVRHQTKVLLVTVAYYLLAVLVPTPLAALAAGLGALGGELSQRKRSGAYPSDIATEAARRVVVVLLGALVAHAGIGGLPQSALLMGAALAMALGDAVTIALVYAPVIGDRPWRAMMVTSRATLPAEAVQYAVGLLGAVAAQQDWWTLILLLIPCGLVYKSFKVLKEMQDGTRQLLENMADAVDLRDAYTGGHSRRVAAYSAIILRALDLPADSPEVMLILAAARVHDIGKIGVPDAVLNKPGRLNDDERALMEAHSEKGAALLKRHADFRRGVEIVLHHHERWDGKGYPVGLKDTAIPFGARVIAVADSYDAMTSDRPYRRGMPATKAAAILCEGRGTQWDETLVDAFLRGIADRLESAALPNPRLVPAPPEPTPSVPTLPARTVTASSGPGPDVAATDIHSA